MVDIFEEVDEHLRSDRLGAIARRYLPWVGAGLALALAITLAFWAYSSWQQRNIDAASRAYATGVDDLAKNNMAGAYASFATAAGKSASAYRALALMQQAGVRLKQNRLDDAVALFDQAAKASSDPVISDAARLKSALAVLDTAPYIEVETRLKPLTDSSRPYHALAREALALAKLNAGRPQDALADFRVLAIMADAPADVRQRAEVAASLIRGGTAGTLPKLARDAMALPPLPPPAAAPAQATQPSPQQGAAQ
ncbi:MAG TPA: tetratricopeptide repeat protein [Caulobacteraceae bacterium]|nr:tetratricopeptide repeat protein [Caulobacteraceae bacterium]